MAAPLSLYISPEILFSCSASAADLTGLRSYIAVVCGSSPAYLKQCWESFLSLYPLSAADPHAVSVFTHALMPTLDSAVCRLQSQLSSEGASSL